MPQKKEKKTTKTTKKKAIKPKAKTKAKAKKTATKKEKKEVKTKKIAKKTTPKLKKPVVSLDKKKYIETIGRRKRTIARVRILPAEKNDPNFVVNKKDALKYFFEGNLQKIIFDPIEKSNSQILKKNKIEVLVRGGGRKGQAEAISLGVARALLKTDETLKTILRSHGFLTRDPRKKERKKFGLKKARKAPQWSKR